MLACGSLGVMREASPTFTHRLLNGEFHLLGTNYPMPVIVSKQVHIPKVSFPMCKALSSNGALV